MSTFGHFLGNALRGGTRHCIDLTQSPFTYLTTYMNQFNSFWIKQKAKAKAKQTNKNYILRKLAPFDQYTYMNYNHDKIRICQN